MPATIPQPLRESLANYPPAVADAVVAAFNQGTPFWLALAIAFGTADAATLFTVPSGVRLIVHRAMWEVTASFTGGVSSAIGVSSTNTAFSTKGDILGGASGDVAATLVSTGAKVLGGTLGAKFGTNGVVILSAGDTLRFDRITSAFTAGAGFVHVQASILPTS